MYRESWHYSRNNVIKKAIKLTTAQEARAAGMQCSVSADAMKLDCDIIGILKATYTISP